MPQKIKDTTGLAARGDPKGILERPHLAALLGAITAEWSAIDDLLADIFNAVSLAIPIHSNVVPAHTKSAMATAIFGTLISLSAKLSIIRATVSLRMSPPMIKEFNKAAEKLRRDAKTRNVHVHKSWHVCDAYPDDLISFDKNGAWIRHTEKDFLDALDHSVKARFAINDLYFMLARALKTDLGSL